MVLDLMLANRMEIFTEFNLTTLSRMLEFTKLNKAKFDNIDICII